MLVKTGSKNIKNVKLIMMVTIIFAAVLCAALPTMNIPGPEKSPLDWKNSMYRIFPADLIFSFATRIPGK